MGVVDVEIPSFYSQSRHVYAFRHSLNTVDVFLPTEPVADASHWIVFIHGGAWRDPMIDSRAILPALQYLEPSKNQIKGIASINYGLSAYPSHATQPSTPGDPSRNLKHPGHLEDVNLALVWLTEKYNIGNDYILAGHSCGAMLTFQQFTRTVPEAASLCTVVTRPPFPVAAVGFNGVYDLDQLVKDYDHVPMYHEFVEQAFGKNEHSEWRVASTVGWIYDGLWYNGLVTVLAHSDEDKLVNWKQTELMSETLKQYCKPERRKDVIIKTKGTHDEVWSEGRELARVLIRALELLRE